MKRYCIMCESIFGCVKGEIKHDCYDCTLVGNCKFRDNSTVSPVEKKIQVTGGICEPCWQRRQSIKVAVKTYQTAHRLKLASTS